MSFEKLTDKESYLAHDRDYRTVFGLEWHKKMYKEMGTYDQFEKHGFKQVIESFPEVRDLHIDIGSGAGWLLSKTAPYFRKVMGIEPSEAAIVTAKEINKNFSNVEFVQEDMVKALSGLKLEQPVFVTSSTVLSHISDAWVAEFLKIVNSLPKSSILFFGEPYGNNIQRKLWHVRSLSWWAENLPNWQLIPYGNREDKVAYGIFGHCVGKENVINSYELKTWGKFKWKLSGVYYFFRTLASVSIKKAFGILK